MRYDLTLRFDKFPAVHTLLYMSGSDAQEIMIEALRRYVEETNHPALDPKVQGAVTMKALGLDPALGLHFDTVLKDIPKFRPPVRPPAQWVPDAPAVTPSGVASERTETPRAPVAPDVTGSKQNTTETHGQPLSPTFPDEPALPVVEISDPAVAAQPTPSSSLADRWLNG